MAKFVVLRSIKTGETFWSTLSSGENPERMANGEIAYTVVAYAETEDEAQRIWRENPSSVFPPSPECDPNCDDPMCPYIH